MYALRINGVVVERHPHKETCWVAALERGVLFRTRRGIMFPEGVEIVKESGNE